VFIDTHAHLDLDQFPDVDSVIESAVAAGVFAVINIGYGPDRWQTTLALSAAYPQVAYTLGFHPGVSQSFTSDTAAQLDELISVTNPVGIGEAGIDLFHEYNPPLSVQQDAFSFQIDLALKHDLPLVIHQRNAEEEVREQLEAASPALRVVLHSFDGTHRLLELAVERGWFIGIGGLMTRRTAPVRDVLPYVPLDHFILETDSPYLVPAGLKERRNTPANLPVIAERFAGLRGISVEEVASAAWTNSFSAFPRLESALALDAMRP
jgi:TatD DNase family protein